MKNHYSGAGIEAGPTLNLTFAGDELELCISSDGITLPSGWFLRPKGHLKVGNGVIISVTF